jgi:hypothetical protein
LDEIGIKRKIGFTAYYFDLRAQQERLPERGDALFLFSCLRSCPIRGGEKQIYSVLRRILANF